MAIFFAQAVSSFLSTTTIHAVVGKSTFVAVSVAAINDAVKWCVIAGVVSDAVSGSYLAIVAAVVGGAVGNAVAMEVRKQCRLDALLQRQVY